MKKNFIYALLSATALLGAATFTSCKSDPEVVDNPNYDPETKMVNAQFVLNVAAYPTDNNTRQNSSTVQQDQKFRGMQDAWLIALKTGATGIADFGAPYSGGELTSDKVTSYNMGTLYTESYFGTAGETVDNTQKSHRILRMKLPEGSDAMLVYARAIPKGTDAENGKVEYSVNTTTPKSTSFSLVSRLGDNATKYEKTCEMIAKILNYILDAQVEAQDTWSKGSYTATAPLSKLVWKETSAESEAVFEQLLQGAYKKLTEIKTSEYRDGSTLGVLYQIANLATVISNINTGTATSDKELNAQRLAEEIAARIDKFFVNTSSASGKGFESMENIATAFAQLNFITDVATFNSTYKITDDELGEFPSVLGVPHGVSLLFYNSTTKEFSYNNPSQSLVDVNTSLAATNYMYPVELLYFDNSTLRVNSKEVADNAYPDGRENWNNNFNSDWSVGSVSSSTRSIAVTNNINYGVAMLKTTVSKAAGVSSFEDNRSNLTSEQTNQTVDLSKIKLNGVLIGGQNDVGWNYLSSQTAAGSKIIYDNAIVSQSVPTPEGGDNYTMVFDNYISNTTQVSKVYVALEFKNEGSAFYGEKNLIPAGGYFYLVGELILSGDNANASSTNVTWDPKYPVPPYNTTGDDKGKSMETTRIFIQDHVTAANFTLGQYSFQHAYLTVPDMREVQTSLGLSVDLQWLDGLTFTSLLGGGQITGN